MNTSARDRAPRRITFLTWRDAGHPDGGGSERYVEEIASRLAAAGHAVTVHCAKYDGAAEDEQIRGVHFRRRGGRQSVYLHGLWFLLSRTGRSQDVVIDVINGLPFAARLVRRRGILVLVHHVHREQWRMIYPGFRGRVGWFVESRIAPAVYRHTPHVTVSESTRSDLIALGIAPGLVSIVRNGVDVPTLTEPHSRSATPRLCVLARLVPHKQIEHALEVVARLAPQFPELHLDIIGKGWWSDRLIRRSAELGLHDRVTFHGHLPVDHRDELLSQAWLMLAPSIKEGWGISITEAAAVGTPTIAYRGGGGVCEAIVDGSTGLLATDLDDLVALTSRLLGDDESRAALSVAAIERARQFSWDATAEQFEQVVETAQRSARAVLHDGLGGRVRVRRSVLRRHHGQHGDDGERSADNGSSYIRDNARHR